jgi:magnesium chelatase family protein
MNNVASAVTACLDGIRAHRVDVEADAFNGLPVFTVVGLTDRAVQEARERVRSALRHSGFEFPGRRLTVNLAPAEIPKEGTAFDVAIALAVLQADDKVRFDLGGAGFIGELGLDGAVRPVRGALALASHLADEGIGPLFVPCDNAAEAAACGVAVHAVRSLEQLVKHLRGEELLPTYPGATRTIRTNPAVDISEIHGQVVPKRALEIAAAGGHHVLFIGPPGAGKSMLARAFCGLLPDLTAEQSKEVTSVHAMAGLLPGAGLLVRPPARNPHHSTSAGGLLGGGKTFMPGELTLAHHGVLVLDELPEFRRDCLEALREPLEEGRLRISRAGGARLLPARFTLVATANPCPCGHYEGGAPGDQCVCPPDLVARYQRKVSGPLRDRIDLVVQVRGVRLGRLGPSDDREATAVARKRVESAREAQHARQGEGVLNAFLPARDLEMLCTLAPGAAAAVPELSNHYRLSGRGFHGALRVARSIADLDGASDISLEQLLEACEYRR